MGDFCWILILWGPEEHPGRGEAKFVSLDLRNKASARDSGVTRVLSFVVGSRTGADVHDAAA